jgi:hypothetical protein
MITTQTQPMPRTTPVTQQEIANRKAYYERWSYRMHVALAPVSYERVKQPERRYAVDTGLRFMRLGGEEMI